ncbi:starch phosphorylase [Parabacteroides sp. PF5-5]|uniref:alpha-glucan family phosphorylase n=1 Tax=unclassified Parabacteroides TaxID=2649774 RepID=UPI00247471D8|nr:MULTISPECIES: alpha-glucan family phosphorylase [unclassified Parabacteroides]MDH6315055.1 starch phosphorylase [Parabacteroides sp. PF5-13]MDH6326420.1 starch phosphorylase [Parabacteroides sp. PH5-41]MDH6334220.1 starch phosphorylase [Parabacteroides sp. PF5-5]MDH6345110.1 starch phosphorylase [Parabacteroides sp. PH5-46]MDH6360241.1 starch phosphorylase [Parabacteroides sp. PH5-16]
MKIKANYANSPVWKEVYSHSSLPKELEPLGEIAANIWWVWNHEGAKLFGKLDENLWKKTEGNPVLLLQSLSVKRMEEILKDKELMAEIKDVYSQFRNYIDTKPDKSHPSVAYFSMEYGMTNVLKIYSGGLGVLAGDYLKEASDSNIDLTAVGFLYRYGYFTQTLSMDGQQIANYEAQNFGALPLTQVMDSKGDPMLLEVPYPGRNVYAHIWKVGVGRISLYLMDTDIPENSEWDRSITHQLYGGDWENRMKQEYLLGIGGILMLKKLGIKKQIYHCNEGHAALINVQRLVDYIQEDGLSFNEALEVVRSSALYTVHTPVPAGHDYFEESLFGKYMGEFPAKLGISWQDFIDMGRENPGSNEKFSMSVFALNTCQEANGVSWLHGKVSQKMFAPVWKGYFPDELHVSWVTNGVHMPTWAATEWKRFFSKHFDPKFISDQSNKNYWEAIQRAPDEEVWNIRKALKHKLVDYIKIRFRDNWLKNQGDPSQVVSILDKINPNALLIGFGRRFATYKRAHLLFTDLERLSKIVNNEKYPIQFIYTGKAHPADGGGQGLIKHIVEISRRPEFLGKIIFLENYDMRLARRLISGVDVWLNTPTRPLEASGTSGEKAEMNGVLNFSVLDGWWYEGYKEGAGWALTDKRTYENQEYQDQLDAATIYHILENEIIPLYYAKNSKGFSPEWIQYIKNSMSQIAPDYTMKRMLDDYISRFYNKLATRSAHLKDNNYSKAREIAAWKEEVAEHWDSFQVDSIAVDDDFSVNLPLVGKEYTCNVVIDKKELRGMIGVDMVATKDNPETNAQELFAVHPFTLKKEEGNKLYFELKCSAPEAGFHKIGLRVYPVNPELPHRMDFAYVRWI